MDRSLLMTPRPSARPCPRCGARTGRYLVEQLPLLSDLFEPEGYEMDACPCGWTQRLDGRGAA